MGPSLDLSRNGSSKEQITTKNAVDVNVESGSRNIGSDSKLMSRSDLDPGGDGSAGINDRLNGIDDQKSIINRSTNGSRRNSSSSTLGRHSIEATAISTPVEPPDGGWGWMIVIGSILTVGFVPTLFMCFGVFMNAFLIVFPDATKSSASWIPAIMNALMNFMGPITSALVNRFSARWVTFSGGIILSLGLMLSYFTTSVQALYLTYGVLGGIGAGLCLSPGLYLISQYFKKRRGVATGLCMAGGSFCQIVFPFLIQHLLNEYYYNGCILIMGGLTMNICVSAALYRPYDPSRISRAAARTKQTKKKRRKSSNALTIKRRSSTASLSFLTDEGVVSSQRRGSYSSVSSDGTSSKSGKKNGTKKRSNKKKKKTRNRRTNTNTNTNEKNTKKPQEINPLLTSEKSWQSLNQSDNIVPSSKIRARTLSIDSSRTLPDIPEELEDVEVGPSSTVNATSKFEVNRHEDDSTIAPKIEIIIGEFDSDVSDNVKIVNNDVKLTPTPTSEVIALSQIFGSVASIASADIHDGTCKGSTMITFDEMYRLFGFAFFTEGIFYVLAGSFTFMIITMGTFTMFVPTYGVSKQLSPEKSAGLLSVIAVASVFGRLILPSLSDYVVLERKHIYAISSAVTSCAVLSSIFVRDYVDLVCCLVFFGFGSGGCLAISINVFLDYISLERFTSFFGLVGLVVGAGNLFATPLMALLVDTTGSYVATFASLSIASALSGGLLYLDRFTAGKRTTSKTPKPTPV